jgi:putative membrane protein
MLLWIKALHVVAVISWMAGLLYLPRLFVYHVGVAVGSEASETFKVMERRLLRAIMTPAMAVAWGTGLWLAVEGGWLRDGWLHAKVAAVAALTGAHVYLGRAAKALAGDAREHGARHWRIVNEAPTLLMIAIVTLVIVKPF